MTALSIAHTGLDHRSARHASVNVMRIAHLSDPHLLDLTGVSGSRLLLNKRLTGMVNIKLHRGVAHRLEIVEAMMDDIRTQRIDHVVITGDITNLALETEFDLALSVFKRMGLRPDQVSVVPGNHDLYTHGSQRSQRFARFFASNIGSDLPAADAGDHPSGPFPFVRFRGDAAIVGLSTAVARAPLFASGRVGHKQLDALARIMEHPDVARRTLVLLTHHPLINPPGLVGTYTHGLAEASQVRRILARRPSVVVLHGHLHDRAYRLFEHGGSTLHHLGATSASLMHRSLDRVAGYNVYDIGPDGLETVHARIYDAASHVFIDRDVRRRNADYAM